MHYKPEMLPLSPLFIFLLLFPALQREGAFLPVEPEMGRRAVPRPMSRDNLASLPNPEGQLHFSPPKCVWKEIKHMLMGKGWDQSQGKGMEGDAYLLTCRLSQEKAARACAPCRSTSGVKQGLG